MPQNSSIKLRLRTDLGRSVGVTTAIQLVWINGFTGPTFPLTATAVSIDEQEIGHNDYSTVTLKCKHIAFWEYSA